MIFSSDKEQGVNREGVMTVGTHVLPGEARVPKHRSLRTLTAVGEEGHCDKQSLSWNVKVMESST